MESEMELENAKNEVLRKIGRNLLVFQQLEMMLKYLIANKKVAGYASEINANQEKQLATVKKQTMGTLVGKFLEDANTKCEEFPEAPQELKKPFFSFGFQFGIDENEYERKKQALAAIVEERNELIHSFLPRLDPNSIESWQETGSHLDQQREKILPEIKKIEALIDALLKGRKEICDYLQSEEGKKRFWSPMSGGMISFYLGEIATQVARSDGWTPLSIAGQILRQQVPEELAEHYQRSGHKSLKGLILATELFETKEEPTGKGGIRVLYRIKTGWKFQSRSRQL